MHMMADLETFGTNPSSVILAGGFVLFDPKQGIIDTMELDFDIQSQLKAGRTIDESTLKWWFKQGDKAKRIFDNMTGDNEQPRGLKSPFVNYKLTKFLGNADTKKLKVWGNGPDFDIVMMEDFLRMDNYTIPWKFWNVRCFRTFNVMTNAKKNHARKGTHHNALDDAIYQAECIIKHMGGKL